VGRQPPGEFPAQQRDRVFAPHTLAFLPVRAPHHELDATEYLAVDVVIDPDEIGAVAAVD
jgi:hypothetical protein